MSPFWIAALVVVSLALVLLLASWAHYRYWVARYAVELDYASFERVPTGDGSHVELRRLPRDEDATPREPPVLLVHGLALNHRNNDMTDELSIARHLARAGRDVWLLTLRSGRDDVGFFEEGKTRFDAMARYDLPAGVEAVLERTGAPQIDYAGFSMGGMLLYASLGQTVEPAQLRRVVIMGSPARIDTPLAVLSMAARFVPRFIVPTLRLRLATRLIAFATDVVHTPLHRWVYNPDNVAAGVAARSLVNGFVNIPGPLAADFVRWAAEDSAVRFEGREVTETLRHARIPVLFVAGAGDQLAPPAAVRLAFDAWGADEDGVDKRFLLVGIDQGAAADYGHGDLAVGRFAREDVYEPVAEFLDEAPASRSPAL